MRISDVSHLFFISLSTLGLKFIWVAAIAAQTSAGIQVTLDRTEIKEGETVVASVLAYGKDGKPAAGVNVHAQMDGREWGAIYRTLPSGVAHLLLPIPEQGRHAITVTDGIHISSPVYIQVSPRHFNIIDDPNHQIILEYETFFGPGYAEWGKQEATPILGEYSSLDPRIIRQHALWFNEMGINVVELDWTNNLTTQFPGKEAKECIAAMDTLLAVYIKMHQHPKILMLMGPENNLWRDNHRDTYNGPWFKTQMDYIWTHYVNNPKYRDMFVKYEGKPLMLYYLNGPRFVEPPDLTDPRFTTRYVGAWLQFTHEEKYGVWSWYDQNPVPTMYKGQAEALTVTNGYPSEQNAVNGLNSWTEQNAGGKDNGETYRRQWEVAQRIQPRFLFVNQWNEFEPPDEYDANLSNDIEPTLFTEKDDPRASGWGSYYMDLTRHEIADYHVAISKAAQ